MARRQPHPGKTDNQDDAGRSSRELAEEPPEAADARYSDFYNLAPVGLLTISSQDLILEANLTASNLIGASKESLRNQPFTRFVAAENQDIYRLFLKHIFETGKPQECDLKIVRQDCSKSWIHMQAALLADTQRGEPVCHAGISDIAERKRQEEEKTAQIHHLTSLNRIYRAFDPALDMETSLQLALKEIMSVFDCDRAFLLHPLDKDAKTYKIPFEQTKPEYPGASTANKELPVTKEVVGIFQIALETSEPVSMNLVEGITDEAQLKQFDIKTQLVVPLYPKTGKPWMLGMHQCSSVREWTKEERGLFGAMSLVISDKLNNLLLVRNLSESELKYRSLIESSGDAFFLADADTGILLDCNRKAEELVGRPKNEIIGMHQSQLHPKEKAEEYRKIFKNYVTSGKGVLEDLLVLHKDGRHIPVDIKPAPFEMDGKLLLQGAFRDITDRKRADMEKREALDRLQKIASRVPGVVYQFRMRPGGGSCFPYASEALRDICGVGPEEVLDDASKAFAAVHPDDLGYLMATVQASALDLTPWQVEFRMRFGDGAEKWLLGNALPEREPDGGTLWHGVIADITERKQAEKAIIAAKEEAERANKAKSVFLSSMSHEIRTPLTSVIGFSQLLASDTGRPLSDSQRKLLKRVMDSGEQLLELVNSALDLAKIESGEIEKSIESVELKSIAVMALTSSAHMAKDSGVKLSSEIPTDDCYVLADPILLRQAITNLLSNAIKYNKKGGEAILSWKQHGENRVRISVTDEGVGISEDNIRNLYKPFDRMGMEGRNIKGFGVGLTIVKRLVESMGGAVGVESEVGKGSKFYIDLPAGKKRLT